MKYEIRWAQEKDARDLGIIHSASWRAAYKEIVPDEVLEGISPEKREEYFANAIKCKSEETAIIKADDRICGFITLGRCRDEDLSFAGEIWGIYLSPDYYHKGIGGILLNWGMKELEMRGFVEVTLWVLEDNINARKFYEKNGFAHDGTVKSIDIGKKLNEVRYIGTL